MKKYQEAGKPFPWIKQGRIYEPHTKGFTHASHPTIVQIKNNLFILALTQRDHKQRSHIFLTQAQVGNGKVSLLEEPRLALKYGPKGYFDCDGVIGVCFVKDNGVIYLYYVGWQNLPGKMWTVDTGRAILDPENLTLTREFPGPVMSRNKYAPVSASGTAFYIKDGIWHAWYNSVLRWVEVDGGLKHYYGLHHATSKNGLDWQYEKEMCIPFADEYEYAFGRPSVILEDDTFLMWFAHRATKDADTYRIGFATSTNGSQWKRNDALSGITVSPSGWDSEMICYPMVFKHEGIAYMLYNGNGYGKTGIGLATLEDEQHPLS